MNSCAVNDVRAVIVPVGGANFGSLRRACERVGVTPEFSDDPLRIANATHVILPGVGAAGAAMRALRERGLDRVLTCLRQPLLGICLGMQLLFERSDEDDGELLGMLPGRVRRLVPAPTWPHMGWNTLVRSGSTHALLEGVDADDWFYFVHGYAAPVDDATVASTEFGTAISTVVARDNVFGVQFHPEKSAASGRRLLRNFFSLDGTHNGEDAVNVGSRFQPFSLREKVAAGRMRVRRSDERPVPTEPSPAAARHPLPKGEGFAASAR